MSFREYNFDGLIGPTHNYAGLAIGNLASAAHQNQASSPKAAALQGLQKMKHLADLGIGQGVLPPLRRPRIELLGQLGFCGTPARLIEQAWKADPRLVAHCYSASNMWTANAATVSPSVDCDDGRVHLTPANLCSSLHRSIEATSTTRNLRAIFADPQHFVVHDPLPCSGTVMDEGAANHLRLTAAHGQRGVEIFVFGNDSLNSGSSFPARFPARQTLAASEAVARRHALDGDQTSFWQQNPAAIDAGVFHNDVIAVSNENVLLLHEYAFDDQSQAINELQDHWRSSCKAPLYVVQIANRQVSLANAVGSYLFNSQLITLPDGTMRLICPVECEGNDKVRQTIDEIVAGENPIASVDFVNLRQSMNRVRASLSGRPPHTTGHAGPHPAVQRRWASDAQRDLRLSNPCSSNHALVIPTPLAMVLAMCHGPLRLRA